MKYDTYFNNQESIGIKGFVLLPYLFLMLIYMPIAWLLSILPGLSLGKEEPGRIDNPKKKKTWLIVAYIFSIIVWLLIIYLLFSEFNNCKAANLSILMCIFQD